MSNISQVKAREILDSRGNPTVEVDVLLSDGSFGRASVPSGASTGTYEALELRDGDLGRFDGRGVLRAIGSIQQFIAPAIIRHSALDQEGLDNLLVELDGTPDKAKLGANAILGVSVAVARAAAKSKKIPLYRHLYPEGIPTLPVPMLNVINGGKHADWATDFQEFMVVPAGFETFKEALRAGVETYHSLKEVLRARKLSINVGDEGGFAPMLSSNQEAVELIIEAIKKVGYRVGTQMFIALDVAATELQRKRQDFSSQELSKLYEEWLNRYPIISIEDAFPEDDWEHWRVAQEKFGDSVQMVGDDLYTTNPARIQRGIEIKASNAVLIKPNQIGTVTETLKAVQITREAGWNVVVSHRSGETEDTTIADLAVGTAAGQIKAGAPARSERLAKYNRLLRIEEELGDRAVFAGRSVYQKFL